MPRPIRSSGPYVFANIPKECNERELTMGKAGRQALAAHHIELAGISELVPPYEIQRNLIGYHVLLFTFAGEGWLASPEENAPLPPGTLSLLPAGSEHRYGAAGPWSMFWFHLSPVPEWNTLLGARPRVLPARHIDSLRRHCEEYWSELATMDALSPSALASLAGLMATHLKRELFHSRPVIGPEARLEKIWPLVMQYPERPWTVNDVCKMTACGRTHLHMLCKKQYGMSLTQRIALIRMELARSYLRRTNWTLEAIAERVGYSSPFAFSHGFKRIVGQSPKTYRDGLRAK